MDQERKVKQSLTNLTNAMNRLEEALNEESANSLMIDGIIQRFEFTIELYWKTLKRLLLAEGIDAKTPKESLREAYQAGWIDHEEKWLQMLKDRNETSHVYNEEMARKIVENIRGYFPIMQEAFVQILARYEKTR